MIRKVEDMQSGLRWLAAALVVALSGCMTASNETKVDENAFPANYKTEVIYVVPNFIAFPTKIRDASISEPALTSVGGVTRYASCVRFTPRVNDTQYGAPEVRIVYFVQGNITQFIPANKAQCGAAAYKPFPELEKICPSGDCK